MTCEETPVLVVDENRKITALLEVLLDQIGVHDRVVVHTGSRLSVRWKNGASPPPSSTPPPARSIR